MADPTHTMDSLFNEVFRAMAVPQINQLVTFGVSHETREAFEYILKQQEIEEFQVTPQYLMETLVDFEVYEREIYHITANLMNLVLSK